MPLVNDPLETSPDHVFDRIAVAITEALQFEPSSIEALRVSLLRQAEQAEHGEPPFLPNAEHARQLRRTIQRLEDLRPLHRGPPVVFRNGLH